MYSNLPSQLVFINSTLSYNYFNIINTNTDGSCCYDSIYKLLKLNNIITDNITTKNIQEQAVKWINNNKKLYLHNFNMTIEEYVLINHNLNNIKEYINYYKSYSGDDNDNIPIQRWGGIPELIALSHLYKININIYTGKTYHKSKHKIIKGAIINNKPRKDFRFQLLLCTTRKEYDNTYNILYYENKYIKHFYALILNETF
jgi:hypothetical protein